MVLTRTMLISQLLDESGLPCVAARTDGEARVVNGASTIYDLARQAIGDQTDLVTRIHSLGLGEIVNLQHAYDEGRLDVPLRHPEASRMYVTGTGLTHLGSAATRDAMHAEDASEHQADETDSMRMFRMGLEGGKPPGNEPGVQPEWFYKGNGENAIAPGAELVSPWFAEDAGEEPEIAGLYILGDDRTPYRIGFALSNELSDHIMERRNYLYLAHSKVRPCSFGPELLIGELPDDIRGVSRIMRAGKELWSKEFLTGEANMSHTIANLEHHQFKYDIFRHPGDVHVHMFGTATLSFADSVRLEDGDVIEIESSAFGLALRNPLRIKERSQPHTRLNVRSL